MKKNASSNRLRAKLHEIIFEADTPAGKLFFLFAVLTLVIIFGALIYLIEDLDSGFTSIPKSFNGQL